MSSDLGVKRTLVGHVTERVRSGKCLLCEDAATRRGLCMNHYQTFLRRFAERQDKAEFETACIREGKILAVGKMREIKTDDPFADL